MSSVALSRRLITGRCYARAAMSPTDRNVSLASRLGVALLGLALAVFFGALGVMIVGAPMNDPGAPSWIGWFLRGFIALIFGAIAALGLVAAYHATFGE